MSAIVLALALTAQPCPDYDWEVCFRVRGGGGFSRDREPRFVLPRGYEWELRGRRSPSFYDDGGYGRSRGAGFDLRVEDERRGILPWRYSRRTYDYRGR